MSEVVSVRFPTPVAERLRVRAASSAESASGLAQRLVDEGLRMDAHPGVVFRSGPSGRRAALTGGPDVWEVVGLIRTIEPRGEEAIAEAAQWLSLSDAEVRVALAYYGAFPDEVEAGVEANEEAARKQRRASKAQHRLLE